MENKTTCMSGKYKSLCKHNLLTNSELLQVREAERQNNLQTCLSGAYAVLCDRTILSQEELVKVNAVEASAKVNASNRENTSPRPSRVTNGAYLIEMAHDDELFIINGEKYEAQTYCIGWEEGDEIIFIEGSEYGACASAEIFNLDRRESCDVWCE